MRFIEWKTKQVQTRTLEKYRGLVNWMREYLGDRPATDADAEGFINWLGENLAPGTTRERLLLLRSGWRWGLSRSW